MLGEREIAEFCTYIQVCLIHEYKEEYDSAC